MDWKLLIDGLSKHGFTQSDIAAACGCSQPFVSQLASGARGKPGYQVGNALVALAKKHARQSIKNMKES